MFVASLFMAFVAFPESNEAIFAHEKPSNIIIETSGSLGLYFQGKCHATYGNETILSNKRKDWCSNIAEKITNENEKPFIQFSLKDKQMKVKKYAVRNGCCDYIECCCTQTGELLDGYCCCDLYSYSLLASNDKRTWITLHKVEKDDSFYGCLSKTFDIQKNGNYYRYYRFVLDQEYPGCKKCMQLNQIEMYGETNEIGTQEFEDTNDEDDESISIIGRVKRNE